MIKQQNPDWKNVHLTAFELNFQLVGVIICYFINQSTQKGPDQSMNTQD